MIALNRHLAVAASIAAGLFGVVAATAATPVAAADSVTYYPMAPGDACMAAFSTIWQDPTTGQWYCVEYDFYMDGM